MSALADCTAHSVRAVLFDLDGTLIDSAPDLAGAANQLRQARGLPDLPLAALRPMVGSGARGMLRVALQVDSEHAEFESLKQEFLQQYQSRMLQLTQVFEAVPPMLQTLQARGLPWGIVSNKAERYTVPIVAGLPALAASAVVLGGDSTPHAKPHPAPLLEAARRMGVAPTDCVYVGDDERDIQAGRAAGMRTVAVAWGYLGQGKPPSAWGADFFIQRPDELISCLQLA